MGLQRFKKHVADSVVNAQNASLDSMNPDQLLDLFDLSQYSSDTPADASSTAPVDEAGEITLDDPYRPSASYAAMERLGRGRGVPS